MNNRIKQANGIVEQGRPAILKLLQSGRVGEADVAFLRREVFGGRSLSRIEMEDLFALDAIVRPNLEAWIDFFVETVTDHVVWDLRPTGILVEEQARWLFEKIDAAQTASSFAILINILEEAHRVPRWYAGAVRARAAAGWPSLASSLAEANVAQAA